MARRKRYLIAGTGQRVGKTTIGCALGFAMRARGMRVGVMKPADTLDSQDAQALALAVGSVMPMELICPFRHDSRPRLRTCATWLISRDALQKSPRKTMPYWSKVQA